MDADVTYGQTYKRIDYSLEIFLHVSLSHFFRCFVACILFYYYIFHGYYYRPLHKFSRRLLLVMLVNSETNYKILVIIFWLVWLASY